MLDSDVRGGTCLSAGATKAQQLELPLQRQPMHAHSSPDAHAALPCDDVAGEAPSNHADTGAEDASAAPAARASTQAASNRYARRS